jgi:hypothetical protein
VPVQGDGLPAATGAGPQPGEPGDAERALERRGRLGVRPEQARGVGD